MTERSAARQQAKADAQAAIDAATRQLELREIGGDAWHQRAVRSWKESLPQEDRPEQPGLA